MSVEPQEIETNPRTMVPVEQDETGHDQPEQLSRKQKVFAVLRQQGFGVIEAAELAGFSKSAARSYAYKLDNKLRHGLLAPLVPLAKRALKLTLAGKAVGNANPPRAADVVRAAELVLDREEPKVTRVDQRNLNVTVTLTPEEREKYKRLLGLAQS